MTRGDTRIRWSDGWQDRRPVARSHGQLIAVGLQMTLILSACESRPPPASEWHQEDGYRWRQLAVSRDGPIGFTRLAASRTGVEFTNTAQREETRRNQHLHLGSGVAIGDVDDDGLPDIYLASLEGPNALYRNLGDWRFEEVAELAGVTAPGRYSTGAVFVDIDGDEDLDLLTTSLDGQGALFLNDGRGRFTEATREAGLDSTGAGTTMSLADVDGDGDLDLYVANYKFFDVHEHFSDEELSVEQAARKVGEDEYELVPALREHFRLERVDGEWTRTPRADPDRFYLNDGTGRFEPVAWTSGRFLDEEGKPLSEAPELFGLAARFYDVDDDGDPDLYVCNDFLGPDHFWINDGTGTFHSLMSTGLRTTSNASMAVDFADIERDGDVDFYVTDMLARDRQGRHMHNLAHPPPPGGRDIEARPQWQRNTLLLNRGDGTYAQIAEFADVDASDWSWTTLFLDVDLDGYEDILVATGYSWDVYNIDVGERLESRLPQLEWAELRQLYPPLKQRNVAFRNNGDLTFDDAGERWGFGTEEDISQGMASGDLDGDGDLDLVVNRLGSPASVLRNDTGARRVAVRLDGRSPNTQGIGAKIRVRGEGLPEQEKEVTVGGLYLSGSEPLHAFAAGDAPALTIVVDWRGGARSVIRGARPDRLYEIHEPPRSTNGRSRTGAATEGETSTFFVDVSDRLDHVHVDSPFDDFRRQPLLPNQLDHLGPGVSWYDVDSDGDEDLLIGAGRGGRLTYYRNDGGRFAKRELGEAAYDQTAVLSLPGPGAGSVLLVGQSAYEAMDPREILGVPSVLRLETDPTPSFEEGGMGEATALVRGDRSSTGPLALADYDGDGDLDLFVGGRVIPAVYPAPASSRLFLNDDGRFTLDERNESPLSLIGLVSASVFSDIDGDGDPDLLLALEWGAIRLLENRNGRFVDRTEAWKLAGITSRWNGIAVGDFDGDGRLDIVATSWGRNTRRRPEAGHPLLLYYGDFDNNGSVDMVESRFDERLEGIAPLTPPLRLLTAVPPLRERVPTHAAYAAATVDEILGPAADHSFVLEATTSDHLLFLNRGRYFEPVPLPTEAQLAPAFHAGVADFDGDGHEDLFISQNFFATELGTPRHDAGRGLWLEGDGTGRLVAVPGQVSGVMAYGDQRGAALADFDQDGRVDLAVSQNSNATKLFRNRRARPGLRVRLIGPPENPHAFGATVRMVYKNGLGPAREIHAGGGYWSQDGPVAVLGKADTPTAVWVRWPGGEESTTPLPEGAREVRIRIPGPR